MISDYGIPTIVFLWGFFGGFSHCIGMCGVFVAAYTITGDKDTKMHPLRHALFHCGRIFSLMVLGAIAGLIGDISHRWISAQGIVSLVTGLVILGLALGYVGVIKGFRIPEPDIMGAGGGIIRRQFIKALQSKSRLKPLLIGFFVGLLPCGLTYQALIPAALSGSVYKSVITMALFGFGTVPGLLTLGLFGGALFGGLLNNLTFRNNMVKVSAVVMLVTAIGFIYRGVCSI